MNDKKPETIGQYEEWLADKHNVRVSSRTENQYRSVADRIKADFEQTPFWKALTGNSREYSDEYKMLDDCDLWTSQSEPVLYVKPFDSFFLKTFRRNVLQNPYWPDQPDDGWILPENWFSRVNDVVRTLLVVKYLDGVEFMVEKTASLCGEMQMHCQVSWEAREEGYYAAHLCPRRQFEIPGPNWDTRRVEVSVEIQITTQLQDVIRKLLHKHYEDRRKGSDSADRPWQWAYKSDEFGANYLGHILHYVEGMIMEVRSRQST